MEAGLTLQVPLSDVDETMVFDQRMCEGIERRQGPCELLPPCQSCVPVDCAWSEWSDWVEVGACTGLKARSRGEERFANECGKHCEGVKEMTSKSSAADMDDTCVTPDRDCAATEWSAWSLCNLGTGQKYRNRSILSTPEGRGKPCTLPLQETVLCHEFIPRDCALTAWGNWTACTATCGGGSRSKLRRVRLEADSGGRPCEGDLRIQEECNGHPCSKARDCRLSEWAAWSACGPSSMQKTRTRSIDQTALGSGKACLGIVAEVAPCGERHPMCYLHEWSAWSTCSETCGHGSQYRSRTSRQGAVCNATVIKMHEVRECHTKPCPEDRDCVFSAWGTWSDCATCGQSVRNRSRTIAGYPREFGLPCFGALVELEDCQGEECKEVPCKWGEWDDWDACTATCGRGSKRRNRVIVQAPRGLEQRCEALCPSEIDECNPQPCEEVIDGKWAEWSEWAECSATCGTGFKSRHREASHHPNSRGKPLTGLQDDYVTCGNPTECVTSRDCELGGWSAWGHCGSDCDGIQERTREVKNHAVGDGKPCGDTAMKEVQQCNPLEGKAAPEACGEKVGRPCKVGEWGAWGTCSSLCGGGQRTRMREIIEPASYGAAPCNNSLAETGPCNLNACDGSVPVDCSWGDWMEWNACTKSCSGGQKFRHRSINTLAKNGGNICGDEGSSETASCGEVCNQMVFCTWTPWSEGECSAECGASSRIRQRQLEKVDDCPKDMDFFTKGTSGMACSGYQTTVVACESVVCESCTKVDCDWGDWGEWSGSECTQLCSRNRAVNTEAKCGGKKCEGRTLQETKVCFHECTERVDCILGTWEAWDECGNDDRQRKRKRYVIRYPHNGGIACTGATVETGACAEFDRDPIDCLLGEWTEWTQCSSDCGKGWHQRKRNIMQSPYLGGQACPEDLTMVTECETPCPTKEDCQLTPWSGWTDCIDGQQFNSRGILVEGSGTGKPCSEELKITEGCNGTVDCVVSAWTAWHECSETCGGGQTVRHRHIGQNPSPDGKRCPENLMETTGCHTLPCGEPCLFSAWSAWTACGCSAQQERTRTVEHSGSRSAPCQDVIQETKACSDMPAECTPKDCLWKAWSAWTACSRSCAGGQRARERTFEPPQHGGKQCAPQDKKEVEGCNLAECGAGCIDGAWGEWNEWTECSKTCRGGLHWRYRDVAVMATCGLPPIGLSREMASCNVLVDCEEVAACEFDAWGPWGACSGSCEGVQLRTRTIKTNAIGDGARCRGTMKEAAPCNVGAREGCGRIRIPCELSEWEEWSECTATCGGGVTYRYRQITTPPSESGLACERPLGLVQPCNEQNCEAHCVLKDCEYGSWSSWSMCDKWCGQILRNRNVISHGTCGGKQCSPTVSQETRPCERHCHKNMSCSWDEWEDWGECTATCGYGSRERERKLMLALGEDPLLTEASKTEDNNKLNIEDLAFEKVATTQLYSDDEHISAKMRDLKGKTERMEARRLQEVIAAFSAGVIGLLAFVVVVRIGGRRMSLARLHEPVALGPLD